MGGAKQDQLYHTENDPSEQNDLASQEKERATQMRAAYDAWYAEVYDYYDNTFSGSAAPEISELTVNPAPVAGQGVTLRVTASDVDDHDNYITYAWTVKSGNKVKFVRNKSFGNTETKAKVPSAWVTTS